MHNEITEQWDNIAKATLNSVKELGSINVRVIEQLTAQQLAVLNTCLEASQKEIDIAGETKDPQELIKLQSEIMSEYNTKLMSIVKNTTDILNNCNAEISSLVEKGMKSAAKIG